MSIGEKKISALHAKDTLKIKTDIYDRTITNISKSNIDKEYYKQTTTNSQSPYEGVLFKNNPKLNISLP